MKRNLLSQVFLSLGDALFLPFQDHTFRASMIAFGLRNIPNKEQALFEMIRVVKKGGKVIVLEFTFPRDQLIRRLYSFYFKKLLPCLGGLISGDRGLMLTSLNRSSNSLMQKIMRMFVKLMLKVSFIVIKKVRMIMSGIMSR
jgi:ubiquinone/menaquinone biosynthesis C-methylase UbiE